LLAPVSPTTAFPIGSRLDDPVAMYLADTFTLPVSAAGLPAMSVPAGLSAGLPVGLQIIGKPWDEARLLRLGRGFEAITADADWRRQEPRDLARAADPATPAPSLP
jgi:aspartyl-tRNA(Asn)/glutamyl-tRNA(Gln) amidotransferase subunit A